MITSALFISALIAVESGGNNFARGKCGEIGCLQISYAVLADVNAHHGLNYKSGDRFNRTKSTDIFWLYQDIYATRERLGHAPTIEDMARIWNGGPDGWKEPETIAYWRRVEKELERLTGGS